MSTANGPSGPATGVDDVLVTTELAHRPSRAPDYAAENRALTTLAEEMTTNPRGVLQTCAELVLELCQADSAGLSLLESGSESSLCRWPAVVGRLAGPLGGTPPREASPCEAVIARDRMLLFREATQVFPDLKGTQPHSYETLLAPWQSNGELVGVLWAIKHTPEGQFDAEDARLLHSLARFAAAAHRMGAALEEAKTGREELERRVEDRTRPLSEAYESVRASEARIRTALEIETVGVIYLDPEGQIIDANDAFLTMGGYSREDVETGRLTWQGLTPPEWMEASERAIAELKATGRTTPYEKEYFRKDGRRWWALFAAKRLPDDTIFEFVLDLTARRQAEERLEESEERFRSLVESWAQAVWETDPEGRVITDSPSWRAYTGQSLEEWLGSGWANAIHPDDRAAVERLWCEAVRERRPLNTEHRLRRAAGGWRWTNVHAAPLLAPDGTVRKWVGMNIDITKRKEAEEALRASEERAKLLLGELQHRVRNTLAVIRSITRRTAETSQSVEDYAMHLDGRINAFARVQTAVARDPAAGLDLTDLVADELLTYVAHDGELVRIAGPAVRLQPKAAETFGLTVHELATNAVKHGALSSPDGRIRVTWRVHNGTDPPRLVFEWKESGTPNRTPKRKRRGFGTDLLERTLTYELKAKTVQMFEPDGLRYTIELPMTERLVRGDSANMLHQD